MSAAVKCAKCADTGMLPGSHDLDCASCGAAVERTKFHQWAACNLSSMGSEADDWAIYLLGRAAGSAQAVPAGWQAIETTPKNMTPCLYLVGRYCVQGFVDATGALMIQSEVSPHWRRMRGKPTHWMPLPAAPKAP